MIGLLEERQAELSRLVPEWQRETLFSRFDRLCEEYSSCIFIVEENRTYTYEETRREVEKLARAFIALGVEGREHVAISMRNSAEYIFSIFALAKIGAVKVSINPALNDSAFMSIMMQADASYLLTDKLPGCLIESRDSGEMILFKESLPKLKRIVFKQHSEDQVILGTYSWEDFIRCAEKVPCTKVDERLSRGCYPDEISDIFYTSGTTGTPKGVMLSHDMLWRSAYASCLNRGFETGRRVLVPVPFCHVYGYVEGVLASVLVGGAVVLQGRFAAPEETFRMIEHGKANDILIVPTMAIRLIDNSANLKNDLSSLHSVYCSASACPDWVWDGLKDLFNTSDIVTGYGMTEVAGASIQTVPFDSKDILMSRVGKVLPGGVAGLKEFGGDQIQYKIVDPVTGQDLACDSEGELFCRGITVTKGYYNNPKDTHNLIDKDGWFKTGDMGRFDDNSYLIFLDRVDDIYKSGGENVSPRKIEKFLCEHNSVKTAVVVGIPHGELGKAGAAYVELEREGELDEYGLRDFCRSGLAKFEVPEYFIFLKDDDWPLTSTGKIKKDDLKRMASEAR